MSGAITIPPMDTQARLEGPRKPAVEDFDAIAEALRELKRQAAPVQHNKCQMVGCEACGPDWAGCTGACGIGFED